MAFDFLNPEKETNAVDVLNNLLKKESINFHTRLDMLQMKFLCKTFYFNLQKKKPELNAWELMAETLAYYKELKTSYKGLRSDQIIKGFSEMNEHILSNELQKDLEKSKK